MRASASIISRFLAIRSRRPHAQALCIAIFKAMSPTKADAVLGFGPSAISQFPGGYAQNISTIGAWRHAVEAGTLPIARGHALNAEDLRRRAIVQSIMCSLEVDLAPWGGWDMFPDAL